MAIFTKCGLKDKTFFYSKLLYSYLSDIEVVEIQNFNSVSLKLCLLDQKKNHYIPLSYYDCL